MKSLKILNKSLKDIKKNPKKVLPIYAIDVALFIILLFIFIVFVTSVASQIGEISNKLGTIDPNTLQEGINPAKLTELENLGDGLEGMMQDLIFSFVKIIIILYILIVFSQGFGLLLTNKMLKEKIKKGFIRRFAVMTLIAFSLVVILIQIFSGMFTMSSFSISAILLKPIGIVAFILLLLLMKYLVFVSWTDMNKYRLKDLLLNTLKDSYKKIGVILPCFIVIGIIAVLLYFLAQLLVYKNIFVSMGILLLAMPLVLTYAKIVAVNINRK